MNLGHERNPVAMGQAIKNLFLVFTGGVTLAMTLIVVQPLSHFPRYKIVTVPSSQAASSTANSEQRNNHHPNKPLRQAQGRLVTAGKPPGETPPKEEKTDPNPKPVKISVAVFHPRTAQLHETAATKAFLKENELRNNSIVQELSRVIDMHECHFERASSTPVNDGLMSRLDSSVAKCLQSPAGWNKIIVLGFTDSRGSQLNNIKLGLERAEKLKAILVGKGIPADRISTASFGAALPIDTNTTESGRARNRRAELNILGNASSAGL